MCKNVFAVITGIIVLTFHARYLTKGSDRGLHRPRSNLRQVPGPGRQMKNDFSKGRGPDRPKRNEFSPGPGLKNPACADLYLNHILTECECTMLKVSLKAFHII